MRPRMRWSAFAGTASSLSSNATEQLRGCHKRSSLARYPPLMNEEKVQQGLIERWICGLLDWLIERARAGYDQKRTQLR